MWHIGSGVDMKIDGSAGGFTLPIADRVFEGGRTAVVFIRSKQDGPVAIDGHCSVLGIAHRDNLECIAVHILIVGQQHMLGDLEYGILGRRQSTTPRSDSIVARLGAIVDRGHRDLELRRGRGRVAARQFGTGGRHGEFELTMVILRRRDCESRNFAWRERPSASTEIGAGRKLRSVGYAGNGQAERLAAVTIDQVDVDVEADRGIFVAARRGGHEVDTVCQ